MFYAELSKLFLLTLLFSVVASAQDLSESHSKIRHAVENKDYASAVAELQTLKQLDEKVFALNNYDYLLARMAEKTGDFATATRNYQAVGNRNSVLSEYAQWHLSQIFQASGNFFVERVYLHKLLTVSSDSLISDAATARLTRSYFDSKDYNTVINILVNGANLRSQSSTQKTADQKSKVEDRESLVLLGQAYLQSGKLAEAREAFTKLTNNLPNPAQPDDFALAGAKALDELAVGKDNLGKAAPPLADTEHFRLAQIY